MYCDWRREKTKAQYMRALPCAIMNYKIAVMMN